MAQDFNWTPFDLLRVVGQNPEMADMDNPHGNIVRRIWFPCFIDELGHRFLSNDSSEDLREVEAACAFLNHYKALPNDNDFETYPVYGSPAYMDEDHEAWERAHG